MNIKIKVGQVYAIKGASVKAMVKTRIRGGSVVKLECKGANYKTPSRTMWTDLSTIVKSVENGEFTLCQEKIA